jgi:hypothetical protein
MIDHLADALRDVWQRLDLQWAEASPRAKSVAKIKTASGSAIPFALH